MLVIHDCILSDITCTVQAISTHSDICCPLWREMSGRGGAGEGRGGVWKGGGRAVVRGGVWKGGGRGGVRESGGGVGGGACVLRRVETRVFT